MPAILMDLSAIPLVRVNWPDGVGDQDIDAHFEEIAAMLSQNRRVGILMDVSAAITMPAGHRKRVGDRLAELMKLGLGRRVVAVAHVTPSRIAQGALTAIYWFAPPPFPTKVFGSLE